MKFILILKFILASLLLEADSLRIKAQFPPKSANLQSRLVLSGTLPPLTEVTVCHWINPHVNRPNHGMYVVSYATEEAYDELLTGFIHGPQEQGNSSEQYVHLLMSIRENSAEVGSFLVNSEFGFLGKWHHLCFTWSSGGGQTEAYLDGALVSGSPSTPLEAGQEIRPGGILMIGQKPFVNLGIKTSGGSPSTPVQTRQDNRPGGVLIFGQEQDTVNGRFNPDQAWNGYISEVHIWDEKLSNQQITALSQCDENLKGNVFAWMQSPLIAEDGVTLSGTDLCKD